MKIFKISVIALLLSTVFISCKKEKDAVSAPIESSTNADSKHVHGIWVGEYFTSSRTPPVYFSFKIKTSGLLDLLNENREVIGKGTWELNGTKFIANYIVDATQTHYAVIGDLSTSPEKISGDWQYDQGYEDTGSWYMDKVN